MKILLTGEASLRLKKNVTRRSKTVTLLYILKRTLNFAIINSKKVVLYPPQTLP